jgi:hypothetical protein
LSISYLPEALNSCAHELGHAHGVDHSPGCGATNVDTNFPYVVSGQSYIGWVGWDNRSPDGFLDPNVYTDMMAYCEPRWVSDYVYAKWTDRVTLLNAAALMLRAALPRQWRILNVINGVAKWSVEVTEPPAGVPESATVIDSSGQSILETSVYRTNLSIEMPSELRGASYMVPVPTVNWAAIQINDIRIAF